MSTNLFPMAVAAERLAELCNLLEEEIEPTDAIQAIFQEMRENLANRVDDTLHFKEWLEAAIKMVKGVRDEYAKRAGRLEHALAKLKDTCQDVLEQNPGIPYQGKLGRIRLQKNSQPKIAYEFGDREIDQALVDLFGIPERFYRVETAIYLDASEIKKAIEAGEVISWATVTHDQHVRIERSLPKTITAKKPKELPNGTTNN